MTSAISQRPPDKTRQPMKIHLCCGKDIRNGWINVDAIDFGQEVIADIEQRWSFAANESVDHIYCKDGFEHVNSAEHLLEEAARVLKPGGMLQIWVPHYKNPSAYRMTHKRLLSWSYFDAFPEPHDRVQNLKVISNKIFVGHKESRPWRPLHYVANRCPRWFERLFYVSNVEVIFQKISDGGAWGRWSHSGN
jgi:predicted SAM-dependent methyltransferase